jgi:DNA integrity scanning protein DisA with diadenylate cyclase activity
MAVIKDIFLLIAFSSLVELTTPKASVDDIDFVILWIGFIASIVGASLQIAYKNLKKPILLKEVFAIYVSAFMVTLISYAAGLYWQKPIITALIASFASYMSLELFEGLKTTILRIVSHLPTVFKDFFKARYNLKDNEDEN